eukprot:7275683-Karenia_brevis.AAC.1
MSVRLQKPAVSNSIESDFQNTRSCAQSLQLEYCFGKLEVGFHKRLQSVSPSKDRVATRSGPIYRLEVQHTR